MKRLLAVAASLGTLSFSLTALAEEVDYDNQATAETISDAVRVTLVRMGGRDRVGSVSGPASSGCSWSSRKVGVSGPDDHLSVPVGDKPTEVSTLYAVFCNGNLHGYVWVEPADVVDIDALAAAEVQRYIEDVLRPAITIGVNPSGHGLTGLRSWFWVEGFAGSATAPPISAFGMTVEVRMSSGQIEWDFGDGTVVSGDLGQAYPAESSVQHNHQDAGEYTVTATIDLVPEFRVDGGPWTTLPLLTTAASIDHIVEQRQPVVVDA